MTRCDVAERELVEQARAGDPQKLDALAQAVRERVYPYLRRVTLDEHKADDLAQDTVLAVLKSLSRFEQADRFWQWVFAIASNSFRQHVRFQSRHRTVPMSNADESRLPDRGDDGDGLTATSRQELAERTQQAMHCVHERYRMVLALRFYEDMSHAEIARVMGCTEFNAKVLFFRGKHALARQLKKLGIGRTAMLAALVAFGKATLHPSSASAATVSVNTTALAEGVIAGLLTAKVKIAAAAVLLLSTIGTWAVLNGRGAAASRNGPAASDSPPGIASVAGTSGATRTPQRTETSPLYVHTICRSRSLGAIAGIPELFEIWWYFPQGANGPHWVSRQPVNEADRARVNWEIETGELYYHFRRGTGRIHIEDGRRFCPELHTAILPTDPADFCAFVQAVDGEASHALVNKEGFTFERDPGTGFVIHQTDTRSQGSPPYQSTVEYNPPIQADPFAYIPPADIVVDARDAMHQRGWTWFRVVGQLCGEAITGTGRIPFTYAASLTNPMRLRLRIGERFVLSDDGRQAIIRDQAGAVRISFAGGSFLKGLSRPWEGFHTLDTVRRDAAAHRFRYRVARTDEYDKMIVRVLRDAEGSNPARPSGGAEYTVATERDLLESARYWTESEQNPVCEMQFTYLESIEGVGDEFAAPEAPQAIPGGTQPGGTPLWPLELATPLGLKQANRSTQ